MTNLPQCSNVLVTLLCASRIRLPRQPQLVVLPA